MQTAKRAYAGLTRAFQCQVPRTGVHDPLRVSYLKDHIAAVGDAIAAGVDVRGFMFGRCSTISNGHSAIQSGLGKLARETSRFGQ